MKDRPSPGICQKMLLLVSSVLFLVVVLDTGSKQDGFKFARI